MEFDATPQGTTVDGVIGLAAVPATWATLWGPIVRFNRAGFLDVRNRNVYAAQAAIPYTAGVTYHVRMDVNIATQTYNVSVRSGTGPEQLLANAFAFRTQQQQAVRMLTTLNVYASVGTLTVCQPSLTMTGDMTPPRLSAPAATELNPTSVTMTWASDENADSQVEYGVTTAYGSMTPLDPKMVTNHSIPVSGLSAGTAYHARMRSRDAAGNVAVSGDLAFTTPVVSDAPCVTSTAIWQIRPLAPQAQVFTLEFDATPQAGPLDGVMGLANGPATTYAQLGPIVRFNTAGFLDARNGPTYAAQAALLYTVGVTYHVRLVINLPDHTYSIYVRGGSGPEQLLGTNFAFRTEQQSVAALTTLNVYASVGTLTVCQPVIAAAPVATGTVYYVDQATGNNARPGTSPASSWQNPPGTRTPNNGAFTSPAWGAITPAAKIQCGDTILLKGGSTQTTFQGGGWRIDNGDFNNGTGFYTPKCPADSPITIRVATPSEWPESQGHFTLNGAGITAPCLFACGYTHGLVHVQDIDSVTLGGNSASQRLVVEQAQGLGVVANNLLVTANWGNRTARFIGQWLELARAQNDGVGMGPAQDFVIRDTIAHDNGWSGFSTGNLNDNRVVRGGFQDVEAWNNGPPTGSLGDQFLFLGCESCYLVRATSHDGYLRGLNFGNVTALSKTYVAKTVKT